MFRSAWIVSLCMALMLVVGCNRGASSNKLRIVVIPKGTTHSFWKSVEAGAKAAGKDLDVEIVWKGPLKESDRSDQIKLVEQFASENVSGIVLAPLDSEALLSPVQTAMSRKIPVVIIDSALKGQVGKDYVSFVATDNIKGGTMAGDQLATLLGGKGKVVLLRYAVGSASTEEREKGFLEAMAKNPGITMLEKDRFGGATVGEAKNEAMRMVDKLKEADGVFAPNESSTVGMLGALQDNNLTEKVKFVGFDATKPLVEALQKGQIKALVAQDPYRMGYEGVKTCVQHLRGQKVPPTVDTGVRMITADKLKDPDTRKFLASDPEVKAVLGME